MKTLIYVGYKKVTPKPVSVEAGAKLMKQLRERGKTNVHLKVVR